MPFTEQDVLDEVGAITQAPDWQQPENRGKFVRDVAVKTRGGIEPDFHTAVMGKLWEQVDDRSWTRKAADFVGTAVSEVVKSGPAMGGAVAFAAGDAVGLSDTGSGTRLKQGVKTLVDATGQRIKQVMPGVSEQGKRDDMLSALRGDLDAGALPAEFDGWLAGEYDNTDIPAAVKPIVDGLVSGYARQAVKADHGKVTPEKLRAWQQTDRNPGRSGGDIPGQPGPRELLADYAATKDPASWAAFQSLVTETDAQHEARLQNWAAGRESAKTMQAMPEGIGKEMTARSMDMQGSPIDLATSLLPFLRGAKALEAARKGGMAAAVGRGLVGGGKEALQEGGTELLSDPRSTANQIGEAAAMGAIGSTVLEGGMGAVGAGLGRLSPTLETPNQQQSAPAMPASSGQAVSPLGNIAAGTFVPEPVQPTVNDVQPRAPLQPILTNVPDAVQGVGQVMSDPFAVPEVPPVPASSVPTTNPPRIISTGKPNGARVEAVTDFVEAADLEPLLLREVGSDQTRGRAINRGSSEQVAAIAASPDALLLGDSPVSSVGAPVVDDVILAGNGRAEGLIQGYQGGGAGISDYRANIVQQAEAMGRPEVAQMRQPVMIRRVQRYVSGDRRAFVRESNPKYATLQETVAESALLDAEVLGDMSGIEFTEAGSLTSSSLQQVATQLKSAQRGVNATTGGKPDVAEATRRVQLASLAKLAQDNGVDVAELSGLLETDTGRRTVAEVSKAAPRLAALDADLGLGDVVLSALRSFSEGARAVSQGVFKNLNAWADNRGQELIRDELTPEAGAILEVMIETVRTPTKLRELFENYLEEATNEQAQRTQANSSADIFGDTRSNVTGQEILRRQMAGGTDTQTTAPESSSGQGDGQVTAGLDSLLQGTESTRPMNRGETARPQAADPLAELSGAKQAGEAEQAQGKMQMQRAAHPTDTLEPAQVQAYYVAQGLSKEQAVGTSRIHVEGMVKGVVKFVDGLFAAKTEIGYNPVKINAGLTRVVATGRGLANERGIQVSTAQSPLDAAWVAAHEMFHRFYPTSALKMDVPEAVRKNSAGKHPVTLSMEKESKAPQERLAVDFANWIMRQAHPEHAANFAEVRPEVAAFFAKESEQAQGKMGFTNLVIQQDLKAGFMSTAGVDALFDLANAAISAGKSFVQWSGEMVKRFGDAIREYLAQVWVAAKDALPTDAAKNVRLGAPARNAPVRLNQAGALNLLPSLKGGTKVFHAKGEPFRVNYLGMRELLTGSPLPAELVPVLTRTNQEKKALEQRAAQLGKDLQSAIDGYVDKSGLTPEAVNAQVAAMMGGDAQQAALLSVVAPVLHERTRAVRVLLDNLSAAVGQTLPAGPMKQTIMGNLGAWLRRSYAAFDPASGWNYDALLRAAASGSLVNGKDAATILNDARAYLQGQNPQATTQQIEADLRDLMDRNVWERELTGSGAKKSTSSLMRRKDIAPEIRAVMGEEQNPVKLLTSSAGFQAQFIARHHGQVAMRNAGLATGLFSADRGGVYTEQIPENDQAWSGMAGLWTTPQMLAALENASGIIKEGSDLGGIIVSTLKALGNKAKLNRVALNPDSWMVNMLGNLTSLIQNGDVFAWNIINRVQRAREITGAGDGKSAEVVNAAAEALQDASRDMQARLTEAGVLGTSLTLADLEASLPRHLLQWLALDQKADKAAGALEGLIVGQAMGRGLGVAGRAVGGAIGAAAGAVAGGTKIQAWQMKLADFLMTKPDALARVTGWMTNYETALASGMAPDAAATWASQRTLNTFPNYAALPGVLKEGSRLGILGSFIAFQYEVFRNFGWNVLYAAEELGSGNPALMQRGLQRVAGIGAVATLAGGGLAALLAATGVAGGDDERNKLFRKWFGAPWEKDAVLAFREFDADKVSYFNTSYLLPQTTITELLQAMREGENPTDSASRVVDRLYEQFVGSSVHLGPLINAAANKKRTGAPLTYQTGAAGALERLDEPLKTILEPGFAEKIERLTYAMREAERNGTKYSVEQEFRRIIGLRETTKTWPKMVEGVYRSLGEENLNIRAQANREISLNRPGASKRAVDAANGQIEALRQKLGDFERDAIKLGIPESVIVRAKREASVGKLPSVGLQVDGKRVISLGK